MRWLGGRLSSTCARIGKMNLLERSSALLGRAYGSSHSSIANRRARRGKARAKARSPTGCATAAGNVLPAYEQSQTMARALRSPASAGEGFQLITPDLFAMRGGSNPLVEAKHKSIQHGTPQRQILDYRNRQTPLCGLCIGAGNDGHRRVPVPQVDRLQPTRPDDVRGGATGGLNRLRPAQRDRIPFPHNSHDSDKWGLSGHGVLAAISSIA